MLPGEVLTHALGAGWDITPAAIRYLAVGYGSHRWQVITAGHGQRWFVTLGDLAQRLRSPADTTDAACSRLRSALLTARALREAGALFVVAPVSTVDGDVPRRVGDAYAMAVYPFVDGRAREFGAALSPADRRTVLPLIAAVHSAPASVRRHAPADDFALPGAAVLRPALDDLAGRWDGGPWGEPARGRPDRMVLTHGEPHPGNFIQVGPQWMLVDWDTARAWRLGRGSRGVGDPQPPRRH